MQRVCIFAGSNPGVRIEYVEATRRLGQLLVQQNLSVVYGGGRTGLMGTIADTVLEAGGEVIGVFPKGLFDAVEHQSLSAMHVVDSMHERKALMANLADGFIALPGGFGTFDELFEITTWAQIGLHNKPVGLLNVADYYNPLLALIAHAVDEGFIHTEYTRLLLSHPEAEVLLDAMQTFQPLSGIQKWTILPDEH